jgi:hypothetical protein
MVDEMDLLSQLKDAEPPRAEAYQRARATLRAAMAEPGPARMPELTPLQGQGPGNRRQIVGRQRAMNTRAMGTRGKIGIGAGIAAVAAGVAVALVATSAPQQGPAPASAPPVASASQSPAVSSPLLSLAAFITVSNSPLPGNASLIIRTQAIGSRRPDVTYSLYTDGGALYFGDDKATLMQAVAHKENLADGMDAGDLKAALYAANGNLTVARQQMATVSPGDNWLFLPLAQRKAIWEKGLPQLRALLKEKGVKTLPTMPTGQALQDIINNRIWNNSVEALSAGGGSARVRAGVLRLMSTIPQVTVANSTTGGLPTLTITAGPAVFGGHGEQVLTINAKTGMPIRSVEPAADGAPTSVDTFQVTRVTLAQVASGKF